MIIGQVFGRVVEEEFAVFDRQQRAAPGCVELAADAEQGVANLFGRQPLDVGPAQQAVLRIEPRGVGIGRAALSGTCSS